MQALWVYNSTDLVDRHASSLSSESPESSVLGSPEPTLELETLSRPESEEGDIESHLQRLASNEDAETDASSIAGSLQSSEGYDESDEDQASPYISDERDDEDIDEDNAVKNFDFTRPVINSNISGPKTPDPAPVEQIYTRLLGILENRFYSRITISDDLSAGSTIEERNLLALRGRGNKASDSDPLPAASTTRSALQEYQMQLMQLEQQRLWMARQEQASHIAPTSSAGMDMRTVASAPSGIVPTTLMSNGVDENTIETNLKHVLEGEDPSKLDPQKLQKYIDLLQAQAQHFESIQSRKAPYRYQIIYRIKRPELVQQRSGKQTQEARYMPFFDHPEWVKGQGPASLIQCNLPLTNFELYLEKNKDIAFIVYRNFDTDSARIAAKPGTDDIASDRATHLPQYTSETVRPVNNDLIEATKALLNSKQEYTELVREFSASLELPAPYLFIYHSRRSLEDFQDSLPPHAKAQLSLLMQYVTEHYADEYAAADSLLSRKKISPEHLRYLFKPGDLLVSRINDQYMGFVSTSWPNINENRKVSRMRAATSQIGTALSLYGSDDAEARMATDRVTIHVCNLSVWHWAFDGNFQRQHKTLQLEIPAAEDGENDPEIKGKKKVEARRESPIDGIGEKNISDLNVFPMQFASPEIVDKCRRRGKTFWKCRTRSYVSYQDTESDSIQNSVDERYMIDLKTHRSLHPENRYRQTELRDELGPEALARDAPPDEQFELLLPLEIKGYNLRRKKWFDLVADRISDVTWNKEAFQNLVIDRKARDLIRALVSNQLAAEKGTDLIMGKGNGLILLLHGGPGTGKTLTAESVAEIAEKPLYRVTCGDVGTKAEDVEKYLESVLHLGKIWGCVVLLDEADVFLEQRSLDDMDRNALVSVFLRVLEYYEGILILTSNRVGTFDEAFKSRIQLALHYPVLGSYQRLRIWENFLNRLESFGDDDKIDITDLRDHLNDLKEEKLNGRQIRNAITTARQYAEWKGSKLTYEHLSDVIEVSGRFDKYLDRLNSGFTQDQLAEDKGLRLA